ncbi:MAG: hypothetical protein IJY97_05445 [Clostridia bacterium]|nr:hypothetical protein [Clostridia bacterium]
MNMHISGSGNIPAGEYEKVSVSGSARLHGLVRCNSFATSGSSAGESIECSENFKISGSSAFSGNVSAGYIGISGSFSCGGELISSGKIICSGGAKCEKSIKCDELAVSGSIKIGEDVEAEKIKIDGIINCSGLLNAEDVEIKFDKGMDIGSIGGSKIIIIKEPKRKFGERLPLLSSLVKKINGNVHVEGSIEGDEIALESVTCPRVTGRVVAVGAGCDIDLVQYSDQIEISPDARVGKTEKI